MAEIKSTIELIMERTKNLTMTEEEKNALQRKEWEGKVKGWVQKYLDGAITIEEVKEHIKSGESTFPEIRPIFRAEIVVHIQFSGDNARLLQLLEATLNADTKPMENLIMLFQNKLNASMISRQKAMKKALEQKKVFGSSVVPNLDRDREWQEYLRNIREDFKNQAASLTGS